MGRRKVQKKKKKEKKAAGAAEMLTTTPTLKLKVNNGQRLAKLAEVTRLRYKIQSNQSKSYSLLEVILSSRLVCNPQRRTSKSLIWPASELSTVIGSSTQMEWRIYTAVWFRFSFLLLRRLYLFPFFCLAFLVLVLTLFLFFLFFFFHSGAADEMDLSIRFRSGFNLSENQETHHNSAVTSSDCCC